MKEMSIKLLIMGLKLKHTWFFGDKFKQGLNLLLSIFLFNRNPGSSCYIK